jgi:uncharacterized protein (DUF697 family)
MMGVKYGCVQQNELKLLVAVMGGWYGGTVAAIFLYARAVCLHQCK